tara:strand:+ start:3957 stop:5342 length:1386 start_codon:yes stop_codon:yes gene_type:complete
MNFNFKENITQKYSALIYLVKRNYIESLTLDLKKNRKLDEKEVAKKIIRSLVPYHNPLSTFLSKYNIFFNSKGAFNDDIFNGLSHSNNFKIYQYSRQLNKSLATNFLPKNMSHWNYLSNDKKIIKAKLELREFYQKLFIQISKKIKIDAWLSGNFGQFDEQEMAKAINICNGKFISFHKECMLSDGWRDYFFKAFTSGREPFEGHGLIVYNNLTKKLIVDSGLYDEKKIKILGMLRLDELHSWRRKNIGVKLNSKKLGVFFTQPTAQFPSMIYKMGLKAFYDKKKDLEWTNLVKKTNQIIYEIACENHDIKVTIKPKISDLEYAINLFKSFGKLPKNLTISSNFYNNASELIKDNDIICAFNSSSILESIVSGKTVISPRFEEANEKRYQSHLLNFNNVPTYANSPTELKEILLEKIRSEKEIVKDLNNDQREVIKYWTNNPSGDLKKRMPIILENLITSN